MSVFELTMEDIEAIKASIEPDRVLARRYGVTTEVIQFIGAIGPERLYPGKIVQVPSMGRQLHNHSGLIDRRVKAPKSTEPATAMIGPMSDGAMRAPERR